MLIHNTLLGWDKTLFIQYRYTLTLTLTFTYDLEQFKPGNKALESCVIKLTMSSYLRFVSYKVQRYILILNYFYFISTEITPIDLAPLANYLSISAGVLTITNPQAVLSTFFATGTSVKANITMVVSIMSFFSDSLFCSKYPFKL